MLTGCPCLSSRDRLLPSRDLSGSTTGESSSDSTHPGSSSRLVSPSFRRPWERQRRAVRVGSRSPRVVSGKLFTVLTGSLSFRQSPCTTRARRSPPLSESLARWPARLERAPSRRTERRPTRADTLPRPSLPDPCATFYPSSSPSNLASQQASPAHLAPCTSIQRLSPSCDRPALLHSTLCSPFLYQTAFAISLVLAPYTAYPSNNGNACLQNIVVVKEVTSVL